MIACGQMQIAKLPLHGRRRTVSHARNAAASHVQRGQRFQDVSELAGRKVQVDILLVPHCAHVLEVPDAVLIQDHSLSWKITGVLCRQQRHKTSKQNPGPFYAHIVADSAVKGNRVLI
ncbi:MAG TPA: hypothetical protein VLY04_23200 [Bryobacteraceae bacterium]|nr:hypothetical protein [Bryobacteraceae bacterium]